MLPIPILQWNENGHGTVAIKENTDLVLYDPSYTTFLRHTFKFGTLNGWIESIDVYGCVPKSIFIYRKCAKAFMKDSYRYKP